MQLLLVMDFHHQSLVVIARASNLWGTKLNTTHGFLPASALNPCLPKTALKSYHPDHPVLMLGIAIQ